MPGTEFKMDSKFGDKGNARPFVSFASARDPRDYEAFLRRRVEAIGESRLMVWRKEYVVSAGFHFDSYGDCPCSDTVSDAAQALAYVLGCQPKDHARANRWKVVRLLGRVFCVTEKTPEELSQEERAAIDSACDSFNCPELKKVIASACKPSKRL